MYDRFLRALGYFAGAAIVFSAFGITVDIVMRNSGLGSIPWMFEVVEYALFLSTFAGAPWVLRLGGHVAVDVIVNTLPSKGQRTASIFANSIGLAVTILLLYFAISVTIESRNAGNLVIKELIFPQWWIFAYVSISIALIVIEFVNRLGGVLRGKERQRDGLGM